MINVLEVCNIVGQKTYDPGQTLKSQKVDFYMKNVPVLEVCNIVGQKYTYKYLLDPDIHNTDPDPGYQCCGSGSDHFNNLHPHPDPHQIQIRICIGIRIRVIKRIQIRIYAMRIHNTEDRIAKSIRTHADSDPMIYPYPTQFFNRLTFLPRSGLTRRR
jgi:hypothetical protein